MQSAAVDLAGLIEAKKEKINLFLEGKPLPSY